MGAEAFLFQRHPKHAPPSFDGVHSFGLPGLDCPSCSPWSAVAAEYPCADAELLRRELGELELWPISIAEFERLSDRVRALVPATYAIVPGASFGQFVGRVIRKPATDFAWSVPWTVFVRGSAQLRLDAEGIKLTTAPMIVKSKRQPPEPYLEIEALPAVRLRGVNLPEPCMLCGRRGITAPDHFELDARTFDASIPLQRIAELPHTSSPTAPRSDVRADARSVPFIQTSLASLLC